LCREDIEMYEEMRVKYLFINLKYPAYVKMQIAITLGWLIVGGLLFVFARDSRIWLLANGWWLSLVMVLGEVIESYLAVAKAKKDYAASEDN
jgi:uncharacterized membrane protein